MLDIANSGKIEIGAIYRMNLDENDEVTPKDGMNYRPKFLIIVGNADYGYYVAYVLVNKNVNQKFLYSKELLDCQYPLHMKDYPEIFKIDPSFANLAKIREIEQERLLKEASYQGKLTEKDLYLILESLKNSEILTVKEKKRFGFIL